MKTQSNFYLFLIALISAMGGFLFGYDWVVIGGAKPFYEQYFGIAGNPVMQGWAMSSALIGCLFGALSAGKLSDRLGRKPILIWRQDYLSVRLSVQGRCILLLSLMYFVWWGALPLGLLPVCHLCI